MSLRYTAFLLLILVGLGAYVYLVDVPREEREERAKILVGGDADSVEQVRLERDGKTILVERSGEDWQIVEPLAAKADKGAVDAIVAAVADCQVDKNIGAVEDDLERFGLATPLVTVTLAVGDDETLTVRVGKPAPIGDSAYIQRASDDHVLLAPASLRTTVDKQLDDLRDKKLFAFEDDDVRWFEIRRGERRIRLERGDDGSWSMTEPADLEADEGAIGTYLSSLRSLRAASFVTEEADDLEVYGLATPLVEVAFATGDAAQEPTVLELGGEKTETEIYAKIAGADTVYTINDWAYRNLDKSARDLRDKSLFALAADEIHAVQVVRKNGDDFRLTRDGDAWQVEGADGPVKQAEVEQFVGDVAGLAGYEIVADEVEDPAAFGFDDPVIQLSVFGSEEAPLGSVVVGRTEADGGLQNFNARKVDTNTVVLLRSYLVNRLDKDPTAFVEVEAETKPEADTAAD